MVGYVCWFVTMDNTWIQSFTPETKEESNPWTEMGESLIRNKDSKLLIYMHMLEKITPKVRKYTKPPHFPDVC